MGKKTKYIKAPKRKRLCATRELHAAFKSDENIQLKQARMIKVHTKKALLSRIGYGKSVDHFKGSICTDCINTVEACATLDHNMIPPGEEIQLIHCVSEEESDSEDGTDMEVSQSSSYGNDIFPRGQGIKSHTNFCVNEIFHTNSFEDQTLPEEQVITVNTDPVMMIPLPTSLSPVSNISQSNLFESHSFPQAQGIESNTVPVMMNIQLPIPSFSLDEMDSIISHTNLFESHALPEVQGIESNTDPVIVLCLTTLRADLDALAADIRALIAYELAAGERSKIRSDTLSVTKGNMRDIKSLHDICSIDYLQGRNKVLTNFATGLWAEATTKPKAQPLPSGNLKARVQKQSDIYKLAKVIEACMGLTTPVSVLPFHFREVVLLYTHTRSRTALTLMSATAPHGSYQTVRNWLDRLGDSEDGTNAAADKGDILSAFDNNQVLKRRWNISVDNRSFCSVITMVIFMDINPEGRLQFEEELKPGNWMWEHLDEQKVEKLKEGHLDRVHQQTRYIKHLHPWLTDIIQQVIDEQSVVDGKCVDVVDKKVAANKHTKEYKTCPKCEFTRVPRRKKICPSCDKLIPSIQSQAAVTQNRQKAPEQQEDMRAFFDEEGDDTTYRIRYEKTTQRPTEYSHLRQQHPEVPPEVTIGEPISLNPCSYEAVAEVFRNIGKQAGIRKYGGSREWITIVCDGLPYILGYQLIERAFVCQLCQTSVQGLSERISHQKEHEAQEPGSLCNFSQEFDWILLQPGPGHVEMNMLKTFVKFTWPVFWEGMVEVFNFRSELAKKSARSVNDHHKGMALARIARDAFAKELVLPYVRQELHKENSDLSVASFLQFNMDTERSPNCKVISELIFTILDAIFLYRAGLRCGDVSMIDAGRAFFARMWCARRHPLYRQLATYDSIMTACMPASVLHFNSKTKSFNLSGVPYSGEGADFKLESINRSVQHWIASNPTDKDWRHACANQPRLSKLKKAAQEDIGIKDPQERPSRSTTDLGPQILSFRAAIRERDFLDNGKTGILKSFRNEPLDAELVHFPKKAAMKEKEFLMNFIEHKKTSGFLERASVPFNGPPIFVTPDERDEYNNLENKSINHCINVIKTKIAEIDDEDMRRTFTESLELDIVSRKGKKKDYVEFYELLEEFEMFSNCNVDNENTDGEHDLLTQSSDNSI